MIILVKGQTVFEGNAKDLKFNREIMEQHLGV